MSKTVFTNRRAYIITGPTSGIGHTTAFELARHNTVVLVGRDRVRLDEVKKAIEQKGANAATVVCDLSDISSLRRAAGKIIARIADRRPAQQRGDHADASDKELIGLGPIVRDEPSRPVRADRSARAASA
jgi:NAD(P)-dependent dehydrogenase (short-subunit alcohol dehydrogenase family)